MRLNCSRSMKVEVLTCKIHKDPLTYYPAAKSLPHSIIVSLQVRYSTDTDMGRPTDGIVSVPFRCLAAIFVILYHIYNILASLVYGNQSSQKVPQTENPILQKSATELASDIRQKQISCFTVIEAFIERQKQVNPIINAIIEDRYKDALEEAKDVDNFLAISTLSQDELAKIKPLLGVPLTVKESFALKGMSHVVGARERIGIKAKDDAVVVKKLLDAGAIPLCVTSTPDMCISLETNNSIIGKTNNPYNTNYTSGGSSGGEGAIISAGASIIGIGSDLAGSIRIPAAFCGIFGHKLSTDLVEMTGHIPISEDSLYKKMMVVGPLCRYSEDLALVTKIITENKSILKLDEPVKLSNLKMYYMVDSGSCFGSMTVHAKIKQRIRDAVQHFQNKWDCEISDSKFDEVQYAGEANAAIILSIKNSDADANINIIADILKTLIGKSDISIGRLFFLLGRRDKFIMPNNVEKMKTFVNFLEKKINDELGDNGVFFYPVFPTSAFRHGMGVFCNSGLSYLSLANLTGLPATTIPVGFIENGLPIAIQVIAGRNQDRLCLSVAKELESVFGGWVPPY